MTQNTGGQGWPEPPPDVQDRTGSGQAQMPVIPPGMGQVAPGPEAPPPASMSSAPNTASGGQTQPATSSVVRVFGDYKREGRFRLEEKTSTMLLFSDMVVDLREAQVPANAEMTVYTMFGDVKVIVPPGMTVTTSGFTIFGDDKIEDTRSVPGGPTLRIHRVGAFGDVKVKTALPGEKIPKRWRIF